MGKTDEEAFAQAEESTMRSYRRMAETFARSAAGAGTTASEERAERGRRLAGVTYEDLLRDRLAYGSPETVVERLKDLSEDLHLSGVIAEMNVGGLVPREHMLNSVRLFADEVVPALRNAC